MLGKLIKHEFRATGRVMGPMLLVVLGLAVVSRLTMSMVDNSSGQLLAILTTLIFIGFVICMIAAGVMALVIMIQRFYRNLLGSEGYLMFTLPTNVHSLVWSKLIVSVVWFFATAVVVAASLLITLISMNSEVVTGASASSLFDEIRQVLNQLYAQYGVTSADVVWYIVEFIANILVSGLSSCLLIYASMAIGHSFANKKGLLSVVFFFLMSFAVQIITSAIGAKATYSADLTGLGMALSQTGHAVLLISLAVSLVYGAIFYVITTLMLKKRLNLG